MVRRRSRQRGSALVEAALVLPLFLLLVFGIFQLAWIMLGFCSATYAARMAVRYAAKNGYSSPNGHSTVDANAQAVAGSYMFGAPSGSRAQITWADSNYRSVGSVVTVSISLNYSMAVPFVAIPSITVPVVAQDIVLQ